MGTGKTRAIENESKERIESAALRGVPSFPGLSFRLFRGDEDYPSLLAVNTGSKIADSFDHDLHTLETIKHVYAPNRGFDPCRDMLVAEVGDKMVAYSRVYWERELEGPLVYSHVGFVLPEWRGKGIGRSMIRWAEEHARELDAQQEKKGSIPLPI